MLLITDDLLDMWRLHTIPIQHTRNMDEIYFSLYFFFTFAFEARNVENGVEKNEIKNVPFTIVEEIFC